MILPYLLGGESLVDVGEFKYLSPTFTANDKRTEVWQILHFPQSLVLQSCLWPRREIPLRTTRQWHSVPLYGCETWVVQATGGLC